MTVRGGGGGGGVAIGWRKTSRPKKIDQERKETQNYNK